MPRIPAILLWRVPAILARHIPLPLSPRLKRAPIWCIPATLVLLVLTHGSLLFAADLTLTLPQSLHPSDAAAIAPASDPGSEGPAIYAKRNGNILKFTDLQPDVPYDLKISLADGRVLRGVNLAWYSREPAKSDAAPLNEDDRRQINDLVGKPQSFYNISRVITLAGSHDRAAVLVERIRSTAFHSAAGGEVLWRVEIWYFTNDFGGWSERTQTNKVLLRERFKTEADYLAEVQPIHWTPALGGIVLEKPDSTRQLTPNPGDLISPATAVTQPDP